MIDDETSWSVIEHKLPILRAELGALLSAGDNSPGST